MPPAKRTTAASTTEAAPDPTRHGVDVPIVEVDNGPGTGTGDQGFVPMVPDPPNATVPDELAQELQESVDAHPSNVVVPAELAVADADTQRANA